jgi:hypothetical protein
MTVTATCHCGGTRIEIDAMPTHATRCTCTYCAKAGALWAYFPPDAPRIVADAHGAVYSATGFNEHHYCSRCGCQTYGISPDWSAADIGGTSVPEKKKFALNARLLDDVDVEAIAVEVIDGRNLW